MNNDVLNVMTQHWSQCGLTRNQQMAELTSLYLGLNSPDGRLGSNVILDWIEDRPLYGATRSKIEPMRNLSHVIHDIELTDYRRVCFSYLSTVVSRLDGCYPPNDYYLDNRISDVVKRYLIDGIRIATSSGSSIDIQGAEIFAWLCYPEEIGESGILAAAVCASFHMATLGYGLFVPSEDAVWHLYNQILMWRKTAGNITSPEAQVLINTFVGDCVYRINN